MTPVICARTGAPVDPASLGSPLREILEAKADMMRRAPLLVYVGPPETLAPRRMLASWDGPDVVHAAASVWPASDVREAAGWEPEAEEGQRLRLMKNMLENGKGAARRLAELETKLSAHQKAERTVGWCSQKLAGLESLLGRLQGEVGNIRNTLERDGMVPEDEDGG